MVGLVLWMVLYPKLDLGFLEEMLRTVVLGKQEVLVGGLPKGSAS